MSLDNISVCLQKGISEFCEIQNPNLDVTLKSPNEVKVKTECPEYVELTSPDGKAFKCLQNLPGIFEKVRELSGCTDEFLEEFKSEFVETSKQNAGKSGSMFMFSSERHFVVKSMTKGEWQELTKLAKKYVEHLGRHPGSILCRFLGMYALEAKSQSTMYFIVMRNALHPDHEIGYAYDLKGTTEDRFLKRSGKSGEVLKDLNFAEEQHHLLMLDNEHEQLLQAIKYDSEFLLSQGIMDYSFLIGISTEKKEVVEGPGVAHGWRFNGQPAVMYATIIDLLQTWTTKKQCAYAFKKPTLGCCFQIDTEPPETYQRRFEASLQYRLLAMEIPEGENVGADSHLVLPDEHRPAHGVADHLAFCAQFLCNLEEQEVGLGQVLALSDILDGCTNDSLQPWMCKMTQAELQAFKDKLVQVVLPDHEEKPVGKTGATAHLDDFSTSWKNFTSGHQTALKLGGHVVGEASIKYALAHGASIGVAAVTIISANLHEHFKPLFDEHPELAERSAAVQAERLIVLPERGSWLSEPHHIPGLRFWSIAPEHFRKLRLDSGWTDQKFRKSICFENVGFIEFTTHSKSGEMFFYTQDAKLCVKTISQRKAHSLQNLLRQGYVDHLVSNNASLIARIYGLYKIQINSNEKPVYFIVQENVFFTDLAMHHRFDFKGSTDGRRAQAHERVLKDLDWEGSLGMHKELSERLYMAHSRDCDFLAKCGVLDYSVMVGIHDPKETSDGVIVGTGNGKLQHKLKEAFVALNCGDLNPTFTMGPNPDLAESPNPNPNWSSTNGHHVWHALMQKSDSCTKFFDQIIQAEDKKEFVKGFVAGRFMKDVYGKYGPFESGDKRQIMMGIIDYLNPWDARQRAKYVKQSLACKAKTADCNPPLAYAARQKKFMKGFLETLPDSAQERHSVESRKSNPGLQPSGQEVAFELPHQPNSC